MKRPSPLKYLVMLSARRKRLPKGKPVTRLKVGETAVLFPTMAWQEPGREGWQVELHGWIFEQQPRRIPLGIAERLFGRKLDDLNPDERKLLKERLRWFMVTDERGRKIYAGLGEHDFFVGKSRANGHFREQLAWPGSIPDDTTTRLRLRLLEGDGRQVLGAVHFIRDEGWSVISDIDDTIKITEVRDRRALIRNTFCRPFREVSGVSALYRQWRELGAVFHYVSASPWQLYPELEEFRKAASYPAGTFHLRDFRIKDRSGIQFLKSAKSYKPQIIGQLMDRFPRRKFVLVGDSGEHDPEIYGELARKHPQQVKCVLIRSVTAETAGHPRYQSAFQGLPETLWRVFQNPEEISGLGLATPW